MVDTMSLLTRLEKYLQLATEGLAKEEANALK